MSQNTPVYQYTSEIDDDPLENIQVTERKVYFGKFGYFEGHNSKVLYGIWLVIELGGDISPTNIFSKCDD